MKKVLYVIVGLVVVYLILCLVGPSETKVERSIVINKAADVVRPKLADLKFFHDNWSPWTEKDPAAKVAYEGECCEPGSNMKWESDSEAVGKGKMTFERFSGDSVVETLHFDEWGDSKVYMIAKTEGAGTNVTWGMLSKVPFMGRAMMLFMNMEKYIAPDYEKGLANLKNVMENMKEEEVAHYDVKEMQWEAKTFYGVKEKLSLDKLPAFFGTSYGKIGEALGKAKAQPIGMPKAIYFTFDEKAMVTDVAAVMEVANGTKLDGVEKFETPAGKVLLIEYFGAYEKSANAHYAMDAFMKEKGLSQSFVLEEYVTDPMAEKDTAKWQTNIYYILK